MQLVSIAAVIGVLWVSTAAIVGGGGNTNSFPSWSVVAGVAVLPPLVMMWRWKDPRRTMSETIQEALR